MPGPLRDRQAIYTTLLVAAAVVGIAMIRRQQALPPPSQERAIPRHAKKVATTSQPPRTLVVTERVSSLPQANSSPPEVAAAFPAKDELDIGPIAEGEAGTDFSTAKTDSTPEAVNPGMRRLAPVEPDTQTAGATPIKEEQPLTTPSPMPSPSPTVNAAELRPILEQAAQLNRQAESLGRRGAYYLARRVTIQALRTVAEALDEQSGSGQHTAALANGLTALRESADFQPRSSEDSTVNVAMVVAGHRTTLLKREPVQGLSPLAAQQRYFDFAQEQLVLAAGGQPVASQSLSNLGKLEARMNGGAGESRVRLVRAATCQQGALDVDGRNFLAANELGKVLASLGRLPEARRVLEHSVTTRPNAAGWQSLAAVHERMGETELARQAREQQALLGGGVRPRIEWVSPEVFAGNQPAPPANFVASSSAPKTRPVSTADRTADNRPKQINTPTSPSGIKW